MQNMCHTLLLFCGPTWLFYHQIENHLELKSRERLGPWCWQTELGLVAVSQLLEMFLAQQMTSRTKFLYIPNINLFGRISVELNL